jgi:hypothetical protein
MRKYARPVIFIVAAWTLLVQSGCYGSFGLTKKVYDFNGEVSDSKFVQSLLFWVLCIIPVYAAAALIDVVILNLIEFWSGSNPISMKEGDYEMQVVERNGVQYRMEATRNQLAVTPLNGRKEGQKTTFVYRESDRSWNIEKDGQMITIAKVEFENGKNVAQFFNLKGAPTTIDLPNDSDALAAMKQSKMDVAFK